MNFTNFQKAMHKHLTRMQNDNDILFQVEVDKDELWQHYLASFPEGSNPIFRERTEHDCSCCRHFIKNMGHLVAINNGKVVTAWDFEVPNEPEYSTVVKSMADYIRTKVVENVWFTSDTKYGTKSNHEVSEDGKVITWEHLYCEVNPKFIAYGVNEKLSNWRSSYDVFKRSLNELTIEATSTVLELIADNSLYRGEEWKSRLKKFLDCQKEYAKLKGEAKSLYCWEHLKDCDDITRIRNTSMGTLLIDISEGEDLETAVKKYEAVVAPTNYKRPKAVFTKKMLEEAQKTVESLGYMNSLPRRFANLDDITANNILFCNRDAGKRVKSTNIFEDMKDEVAVKPKKFNRVSEINIKDFVSDVLPTATNIELLLENRLKQNLVSLTAPVDSEAPSMFKWNNAFGWAYSGNITDSDVKQNVKSAGGNVEGDLRFSIQWNNGKEYDSNDLDAHCKFDNKEIFFGCKIVGCGSLDVDIIHPSQGRAAVENIVFVSRNNMKATSYNFFVHCYCNRGGKSGFRAEIEFDGNIYSYNYNKPVNHNQYVQVATVTLDNDGNFTIQEHLNSNMTTQEVWNLTTNQFVPVSVMMYSPNYWDEQDGIGNRHYFFMLNGCVNPENPRGFFNEYLKSDLDKHKRVFEALGNRMSVQDTEDQLSGVGFSSTRPNHVIVKVKGESNTERILKVKF